MMKKFLATLLAVMMLAVSFGALAEDESLQNYADAFNANGDYVQAALDAGRRVTSTITLSDVTRDFSGEAAVDQVICDLLDALVITAYMQGDEVYYAISMEQASGAVADLLTLGFVQQGTDTYVMSNIIGGTIVVGADEVLPLVERLLDVFVQMGMLEQEYADSIKAELPELMAMMEQELAASMNNPLMEIDYLALNYDALLRMVTDIGAKLTIGDPAILPRNCDAATSMATVTMTPAEMNAMGTAMLQFVKDNPELADAIAKTIDFDNTIAPSMQGVVEGEVDFLAFIDELMAEMAQDDTYAGDVTIRMWMGEDGMPVAMDMVAPIKDGEAIITLTMQYTRLTMNDTVAHSVVMGMPGVDMTINVVLKGENVTVTLDLADQGENIISVKADYTDRSAENVMAYDLLLDMAIANAVFDDGYGNTTEGEISIIFDASSEVTFTGVDFVDKMDIIITVNGKNYCTVNEVTQSVAPGASIMDGDVVRPATLNDNDFVNWFIGAYSAVFSWLQNAIYAMPASFINLLNTAW